MKTLKILVVLTVLVLAGGAAFVWSGGTGISSPRCATERRIVFSMSQ